MYANRLQGTAPPVLAAIAAQETVIPKAVMPVQRLSDAWVEYAEFVMVTATVPVALQAASAGSKVGWITATTCNPASWGTTLATHLTVVPFTLGPHRLK